MGVFKGNLTVWQRNGRVFFCYSQLSFYLYRVLIALKFLSVAWPEVRESNWLEDIHCIDYWWALCLGHQHNLYLYKHSTGEKMKSACRHKPKLLLFFIHYQWYSYWILEEFWGYQMINYQIMEVEWGLSGWHQTKPRPAHPVLETRPLISGVGMGNLCFKRDVVFP